MKIKNISFSMILLILAGSFVFAQNKKNRRPGSDSPVSVKSKVNAKTPVYFYEFSKPEFIVSKVLIEHDEDGFGKITFQKKDYDEDFIEPVTLSEKSLVKLKMLWTELKFLTSDEDYQSKEREYSHLGTMKLKLRREKRERTASFNWTENLTARELANEYRKIGNQYVWIFDMNVARANQPLESPKILKRFDSFLKRNEISDPKQMIPYLKELNGDERVPLITRNHAGRLMKRIEKTKEKEKVEEIPQ